MCYKYWSNLTEIIIYHLQAADQSRSQSQTLLKIRGKKDTWKFSFQSKLLTQGASKQSNVWEE